MDVFRVRDRLIEDYRDFTGSFVDIHDKSISDHVRERMARGYQWPDPRPANGHLVYARGNEEPAHHLIRQSGIKIFCHALDLSQPPEDLLSQMRGLAQAVASAHPVDAMPSRS